MHNTGGQFQKQLRDLCMSSGLKMNSAACIINNCSKPRMTHTSVCWKAVLVVLQWAADPQHLDKLRINGHLWFSCSVQLLMCQNNWGNKLNSKHQSTFNIKIHILMMQLSLLWCFTVGHFGKNSRHCSHLISGYFGLGRQLYHLHNQNLYFRSLLFWFTM